LRAILLTIQENLGSVSLATIETDAKPVTSQHERRTHPRQQVGWPGRVTSGPKDLACTVRDISVGGARVECAEQFRAWTVVTLHIENFGKFHARVVWTQPPFMGLQFLDAARAAIQRAATST